MCARARACVYERVELCRENEEKDEGERGGVKRVRVYSANGGGTDREKERGRGMAGRRGEIGHKKLEEKLR